MASMAQHGFIDQITRPTLVLDEAVCRRNINAMATKAQRSGVRLRPHFKTHQSRAIGAWFRDAGLESITVSSLAMADYFAQDGWADITVAFPVNWREIGLINELAAQIRLGLIVEGPETLRFLAERLHSPVDIWLEIDTGYHRSGATWDDPALPELAQFCQQHGDLLRLRGLLTHAGHTYKVRGKEAVQAIYAETMQRLQQCHQGLADAGIAGLELSIGDTPGCSLVDDFSGADEIRPGNFVFYDMTMVQIGACQPEQIAVAVACPVVAKQAAHNQVVVYGGGVHLSKDSLTQADGKPYFGSVARWAGQGWGLPLEGAFVSSLSQEHGLIHMNSADFEQTQIGDLLFILPVHSCMTADLLKVYHSLDGQQYEMAPIPR